MRQSLFCLSFIQSAKIISSEIIYRPKKLNNLLIYKNNSDFVKLDT